MCWWMRAIRSSRVRRRVGIVRLSSRHRVASVGTLQRWAHWRYVSLFSVSLRVFIGFLSGQTGASLVYTPEQGMDLDLLRDDVKFLKLRYGLDAKGKREGRLVIRYVLPLLPPLRISHPTPQKRARLDGLHDRRHHQDVQRRRRRPLRLALRLPRAHPPR